MSILVSFIIACVISLVLNLLMPEFFDRMPNVDEWFKKDTYELCVYSVTFFKDNKVFSKQFTGYQIIAYLLVRFYALRHDLMTRGNYTGVAWAYDKVNEMEEK